MSNKIRVIIVGGGASGLMAGIEAAKAGAAVTILEKKEKAGKKILATGNGRCNFTNAYMDPACYHGDLFAMQVLQTFDEKAVLSFFESIGIWPTEKNGYYYPMSMQAMGVQELLVEAFLSGGGKILTDVNVCEVSKNEKKGNFLVSCEVYERIPLPSKGKKKAVFETKIHRESFTCDRLILAAGGMASPKLGSDGSGYSLAKNLGHHMSPALPALCGIICRENWFSICQGVRIQTKVSIYVDGEFTASDTGELQLTEYGISGIPVFQVSRHAAKALYAGKKVEAELLFYPEIDREEKKEFLKRNAGRSKKGFYPDKLLTVLERITPDDLTRPVRVTCEKMQDFERAQVTCGGVKTSEVYAQSMESKLVKGLYLCGELLDVDGICGGYNLQWAWSSGHLAGMHAAKGRKES